MWIEIRKAIAGSKQNEKMGLEMLKVQEVLIMVTFRFSYSKGISK